jgi:hypothetical protein
MVVFIFLGALLCFNESFAKLKAFPTGLYLLKLYSNNRMQTGKINLL